ncbi:guanine deaminase [Azospirillum fermentarium]|uniref:guanine deaminase n=1 Tax=Azospirillum fermentarium TaxID=1233114 RepID=UPI002226421F|nr:guanine deaminase [Azospirillum fermentarium]MCW2247248.1 guanine deaminase [Azospirillum fermentarium]
MTAVVRAIRGRLFSFTAEPAGAGDAASYTLIPDGMLRVEDGRIAAVGPAAVLEPHLPPGTPVEDHGERLVMPGFIDLHIHFPQTQVIASYGAQLLDWLTTYTFAEEQKYGDPAFAARQARFFLDELLRNGTTTAVVYGSVHPESVEAFFAESERRGTAMIAGKVMMDRHAPAPLCDTAQRGYDDSKALIGRWHGRGRQRYAVTPRFAITSTPEQLDAAGALLSEHPDCYLQTHLSENHEEIRQVARLFPAARDYTDVYGRFGLLGPRSLLGHCLHLSDGELARLAASGAVAVACPTSNLFIGSGLFDAARVRGAGVRTGLATDVGGGTSYSMLRTAAELYKVLQLQGQNLPALAAFYTMTRGNALALGMGDAIGTFVPGAWADAVVLDPSAIPALAHRMKTARGLEDELFALMTLGDERVVTATYVQGCRDIATTTA